MARKLAFPAVAFLVLIPALLPDGLAAPGDDFSEAVSLVNDSKLGPSARYGLSKLVAALRRS